MRNVLSYIALILFMVFYPYLFMRLGYEKRKAEFTYKEETQRVAMIPEYQSVEIMPLNEYRRQNGLYPLRFDQDLYDSALQRAIDIQLGLSEFNHDNYESHMSKYYEDWGMIGENLARDFDEPSEVLTAWIESETHNENLLDDSACEYGLARYYSTYVLHIGCK